MKPSSLKHGKIEMKGLSKQMHPGDLEKKTVSFSDRSQSLYSVHSTVTSLIFFVRACSPFICHRQ